MSRYVIDFPSPNLQPSKMKKWTTKVLAYVRKMYGAEPTGFYSPKYLVFRVWFEK